MKHYSLAVALAALTLAGCRGMDSENPPIHPNLNMDFAERLDPQEASAFFADNSAMRQPVQGTVARGLLRADEAFFGGREASGEYVAVAPVPVTEALLRRGQERYNIYCSVCHGLSGDGLGIIMTGQYGYTPAPTYHDDRLRQVADGYLYDVITNGVRTMPSYAQQVAVADRWAIVAYIRALQRSQGATRADVPANLVANLPNVGGQIDTTAAGQPTNDAAQAADTVASGATDSAAVPPQP